jgi:hypothetical protein
LPANLLPAHWRLSCRILGKQCRHESGRKSRAITSPISTITPRRTEEEVKLVFADTLYWGAVLHPHDQYRAQLIRAREALGEVRLVTTDEVLTELLDGLAPRGAHLREAAGRAVRRAG